MATNGLLLWRGGLLIKNGFFGCSSWTGLTVSFRFRISRFSFFGDFFKISGVVVVCCGRAISEPDLGDLTSLNSRLMFIFEPLITREKKLDFLLKSKIFRFAREAKRGDSYPMIHTGSEFDGIYRNYRIQ